MKTTMSIGLCGAALLFAGAAGAAPAVSDTPGDYANAIQLKVRKGDAVIQLKLPKEVYLQSRSAALDDVRIFDGNGKSLPFSLIQPAPQRRVSVERFPVKVFPVPVDDKAAGVQNDIEVKVSADGAITSVTTREAAAGRRAQLGAGTLVLDIGKGNGDEVKLINALVFNLPDGLDNYSAQVQLEVSDDLQNWETVSYVHLSRLRNSNLDTLQTNRMEFEARKVRYARVSLRQGKPVQFTSIVAESPASDDVAPALDSVTLAPHAGLIPNELVYDANIAIPVRRMRFEFAEENIVMPALIGVHVKRAVDKQPAFGARRQATFYKINQHGEQRTASEITFDDVHVQQWVVRPQEGITARPQMTLLWEPSSLVFMASGSPPYTLHFGRARATPGQRDIAQVAPGFSAKELQTLEQAVPGTYRHTPVVVGVDEAEGGARLRIIALWSVLLLGVGVLAFMAWRLLGQMKNNPAERDSP